MEFSPSKSTWIFFIKRKHIPPWKYGNDSISPCETIIFTACGSINNIQCLSGSVGLCKYYFKYVGKIDKNNNCTVSKYTDGSLTQRAFFCTIPNVLLLIKSNNQNKRKKNWKHPQGTVISVN